jgi:cytochrome c5
MGMYQKKYFIHFVVLAGFFSALSFFTYQLVDHHVTLPDRLNLARTALLSNGQSVQDRITRIGSVTLAAPESAAVLAVQTPVTVKDGAQVYSQNCSVCHMPGIAGAPKVGDKAQWKSRLSKGIQALYVAALNGIQGPKGVMPAKGGNNSLSDLEVKLAVDYMVSQVK